MRFWELSNKDVINCKNGHRLGCVGDLEIDVCKLCITDFYVPTGGKYCGCLESITRVLSNPQKGHFISYPPVFLSLMFTFIVPVIIPEK